MNNLLTLKSHKNNGAVISLTSEYLLIQGRYYEIVNGYVQTVKETRSLCVSEILQVYTTYIRSRRLLFAFMFPLVIVSIIYSVLLTYINSICIERYAMKLMTFIFENNGIGSDILKGLIPILIFLLLFLLYEIVVVYLYFFRGYHVLRIDYLGGNVAVPYDDYMTDGIESFMQKLRAIPLFKGCIR